MTTREQAIAALGGPQPEGIAMTDLINEVFDRLDALDTIVANHAAGLGITLPTADPEVEGALWADTLTVKTSAGA